MRVDEVIEDCFLSGKGGVVADGTLEAVVDNAGAVWKNLLS